MSDSAGPLGLLNGSNLTPIGIFGGCGDCNPPYVANIKYSQCIIAYHSGGVFNIG